MLRHHQGGSDRPGAWVTPFGWPISEERVNTVYHQTIEQLVSSGLISVLQVVMQGHARSFLKPPIQL
jgi:hypothetical protein